MGLSKRRKKKRRIPNPERTPLIVPGTMNDTWSTEFIALKTKEFFKSIDIEHIPIQKGKPSQTGY